MLKLICAFAICATFAVAADISGTWQFSVETSQGTGTPTVTLAQKGEELTGTFSSQIFGDAKLIGTVKGNDIQFSFEGDTGGQKIAVKYRGTIENGSTMRGTAVYAGFDDNVKWTATKK